MTLGWKVIPLDPELIRMIVFEQLDYRIVQLRDGLMVLELTALNQLTFDECSFLETLTVAYRSRKEKSTQESFSSIVQQVADETEIELSSRQHTRLTELLQHEIESFGPLSDLFSIPRLEEITITGVAEEQLVRVYHTQWGWLSTRVYVTSSTVLMQWVNQMACAMGRRVTWQNPRLNAILPNGSRLHASFPPISATPSVTLRLFQAIPLSWIDFIASETLTVDVVALLYAVMQSDANGLVVGNTGSGKTSLLNALLSAIDPLERVVSIEEVPEIRVPHHHHVRLVSNAEMNVSLQSLVEDSLRMRPDRVVLGEARTAEEVRTLSDSWLSGQAKGCIATMHAQSVEELLERFNQYGIPKSALQALDVIVLIRRVSVIENGKVRQVRRVEKVAEQDENGSFRTLFSWNSKKHQMELKNESRRLRLKIEQTFPNDSYFTVQKKFEQFVRKGIEQHWSLNEFFNHHLDWKKSLS